MKNVIDLYEDRAVTRERRAAVSVPLTLCKTENQKLSSVFK